jgi:hypothetical protein
MCAGSLAGMTTKSGYETKTQGDCYVYEILVDDVVRYIGKGTGNRVFRHRRRANRIAENWVMDIETPRVGKFHEKLALALLDGHTIMERIVIQDLTSSDAFLEEARLIAEGGFGKTLWNEIAGGEVFSLEKVADPEGFREKLCKGIADSWTKQRHEAASRKAVERWSKPASRKEHSRKLASVWADPSVRARHRESLAGRIDDTETWRQHQSETALKRWEKPGAREAMAEQARRTQRARYARRHANTLNGILCFGA